jgi:hypothetical protein
VSVRLFPGSRREFGKLSATLSLLRCSVIQTTYLLWLLLASVWAQAAPCVPSPEIRSQLEKITVVVSGPSDFDRTLAPLVSLRQRYPNDLWVNERYQDVVQQYGIEGHLRQLTEDYQVLSMQHPDDAMYSYLYARSLMGRNTPAAAQQMTEIVADHPDFAPAHNALAEIYASATFHDESREKAERGRFLALCPDSMLQRSEVQRRPAGLPGPSLLIDQAEALLAQSGDPGRIAAMAEQGIRADEWRLQRIRPFDWYSIDYKRQSQRELQAKYWRVWSLQVRCERRAGRPEKASRLLALMEQRAALLQNDPGPAYWDALAILVRLYEEGNQRESAAEKLNSMQQLLTRHPDPQHTAELEDLRRLIGAGEK